MINTSQWKQMLWRKCCKQTNAKWKILCTFSVQKRQLQMTKVQRELCSKYLHGFRWVKIYFQLVALNCSGSSSRETQMQHESTKSGSSWFSMKRLQKLSWWLTQTGTFLLTDCRTQKLVHVHLNSLTSFNIWRLLSLLTGLKCWALTLYNMSKY